MNIVLIGAGNLAWHLAPALEAANYVISAIYSRQLRHAQQLVTQLYAAQPRTDLNFANSSATLFVLAVPDDALSDVCAGLVLPPNALVVHTSGSVSLSNLQQWLAVGGNELVRTGVFYALQSFSRGQPLLDFDTIPICVEASDDDAKNELIDLAQAISQAVYVVNSAERGVLHLAAVFANNFTNHLLALSQDLTEANQISFDLLKPLITETVRKALAAPHPAEVQTGPARRNDLQTLAAHRALLTDKPDLLQIYNVLTASIQQRRG
jgi:predicted short-subunit dehydrogenase-like oxidoreductase (DUF2520 family)